MRPLLNRLLITTSICGDLALTRVTLGAYSRTVVLATNIYDDAKLPDGPEPIDIGRRSACELVKI